MQHFADRLIEAIMKKNNPTVMGLDPVMAYVPPQLIAAAQAEHADPLLAACQAILAFNQGLIDAVCDIVPAVKPQLAFYEALGPQGMAVFAKTCAYAKEKGLIVIADAKRGDIGSTASAYAAAYLDQTTRAQTSSLQAYNIDAITLNAYLGIDGIAPFIQMHQSNHSGCFILVRTSNPSAGDLQDLKLEDGRLVFEAMADLVQTWGENLIGAWGYSAVGAVVGATWPDQAKKLRQRMPKTFILVPGYGAQGATGDDVAVNFDQNGRGAIVNASRSLMCAWQKQGCPENYQDMTRQAALAMQADLNQAIDRYLNRA